VRIPPLSVVVMLTASFTVASCSDDDPGASAPPPTTSTVASTTTTEIETSSSTASTTTSTAFGGVDPPADLLVTVGGEEQVIPAFSYCWQSGDAGVCADGSPDLERFQVRAGNGHRPEFRWEETGAHLTFTALTPADPLLEGATAWTQVSEWGDDAIRVPLAPGPVAVRVEARAADGTASFAFLLDVVDVTLDEPAVCTDDPGGPTDLTAEPAGDAVEVHLADAAGCAVRRDIAVSWAGPEHCGWHLAQTLDLSDPFGTRTTLGTGLSYVRDPQGVYDDVALTAGFDFAAELPSAATDTGLRWLGGELWTDPADPSAIHFAWPDRVERWPLDSDERGCD
jgi:hypothetical protein